MAITWKPQESVGIQTKFSQISAIETFYLSI